MSTNAQYPLTFAEAEQIAKNGGFVQVDYIDKGIYCHKWGGWFKYSNHYSWYPIADSEMDRPRHLRSMWKEVPEPRPDPMPPVLKVWELQDNEIGKD